MITGQMVLLFLLILQDKDQGKQAVPLILAKNI